VPGTYCLLCAPFVPGDTDFQTFLTDTYQQSIQNIETSLSNIQTIVDDPSVGVADVGSELNTASDNLLSVVGHLDAGVTGEFGSLPAAATDLSGLGTDLSGALDPSIFTADVTTLLDPATLTTDLTALLGGTTAEGLTSLLSTSLPDLFTTFAADFATSLF
jgi:hypothetical protein